MTALVTWRAQALTTSGSLLAVVPARLNPQQALHRGKELLVGSPNMLIKSVNALRDTRFRAVSAEVCGAGLPRLMTFVVSNGRLYIQTKEVKKEQDNKRPLHLIRLLPCTYWYPQELFKWIKLDAIVILLLFDFFSLYVEPSIQYYECRQPQRWQSKISHSFKQGSLSLDVS